MSDPTPRDDAATAGRGFLVITAAKLWFMVGGALINFGLPYIFGSARLSGGTGDGRALYGQFIDINNTLSILSMVMITGVMQSVARFVSEYPNAPGGIVRQARTMMLIVGGLVGGGFVLASPWIAESRHNPGLVDGYRAAGLILFCYGVYTVFIGTLNGRKQFLRQALFDITFTSLKATLVLGLAVLGLGVIGAFFGFAAAAFIIMCLAAWRVGRGLADGPTDRRLYAFAAQVMLYTLVFNFIFKLDVLMLKPLAVEMYSQAAGWLPGGHLGDWLHARAVEGAADGLLGIYGLALNISRVPWQATIAITFVVFPMVSEATFADDRDRTRLYIRQTLRYSMILVGAAAVVLVAVPQAIFGLLPAAFSDGALALAWLAPAYFCFSLFNVINTLLMSSGRAGSALLIGVLTIGLAAGLYALVLPGADSATALLTRTGQCTLIAFAVGMLVGGALLWQRYGPPVPWGTALRVLAIGAVLVTGGRFLPPLGKVTSLGVAAAVGLAFLALLVVTREFGVEDRARLMRVLRRRRKG
ncbi:MAG: oligosaccharide flippase family protein [Myxococcales bacterium]|nr:oligosaccharide flippase family protein [Myxococcales bacterium]